jgi:prepilin-type N-terminal cleavage/methylation domain-containing protein
MTTDAVIDNAYTSATRRDVSRIIRNGNDRVPVVRINVRLCKRVTAGFTLVELLVVIGMMAVLAAIIVPGYMSVERSQKLNGCMNHLRAIGVALAMYREDYGSYPPAPAPAYLESSGSDATYLPFSSGTGTAFAPSDALPGHLNDLTVGGSYNGPPMKYIVRLASAGTPDQFEWSVNNGGTWEPAQDIPTDVPVPPALPQTVDATLSNNVTIKFGADTGHTVGDTWTFWVGVERVRQYGLALLYWEYLNDKHDYVRSRNLYHCPAMLDTENVNLRGNLEALWAQDADNQALRKFDPLWSGFNTYDVTYNYDQYNIPVATEPDGAIVKFDKAIGFTDAKGNWPNERRQLKYNDAPADTVVCWCYAHTRGQSPTVEDANSGEPDVVGGPDAVRNALRARRNETNLVLWADGTVALVRPYLTQKKDPVNGQPAYFWTPPYLASADGGVR